MALGLSQFNTSAQEISDSAKFQSSSTIIPPLPIYSDIEHYCMCGIYAHFPGGDSTMQKWIEENVHYPLGAIALGVEGHVYIEFIIEKDGSI